MVNLSAVKVGGVRYNSPMVQVVLVGFVCFCSVGMFSAISNLGAGGTQDPQLSSTANACLYTTFALGGFVAGSINNMLGPRLTLSLGTTGYSLYIGSLWAYQVHGTRGFLIAAGAILGFTASLLWAAQGAIMMSYPSEDQKGRAFSVFWMIFQSGTLVGSAIALGILANSTLPTVSTSVYVAFMIIMLTSIASSWLILPPTSVVRNDGTLVELQAALSPRDEFRHFIQLFKDIRVVALVPVCFSSNYFYAYQGSITVHLFNGRTRALTALCTGLGSILGALLLGFLVDKLPFRRRVRSFIGLGVVTLFATAVWAGGLALQVTFTRETVPQHYDWEDHRSIGPVFLLGSYYFADAMYQGLAYYTMAAMTNDPFKLARLAGYYKGVQSAGAAISFGMDAVSTPYLTEHLVSWILLMTSLPFAAFVLYKTPDTNYDHEKVYHVEDVSDAAIHGAAVPKGHHTDDHVVAEVPAVERGFEDEKAKA